MKRLQKSWLSRSKNGCKGISIRLVELFFVFFSFLNSQSQIVNYVNNGGFEMCENCTGATSFIHAKYWNSIDSTKYYGQLLTANAPFNQVPLSNYSYQWPRHGNNYLISSPFYLPNSPQTSRGYARNRLKNKLETGKTYCVKFYCSITNNSTYGIDGLEAFFGDHNIDTISRCDIPITYYFPQVQNQDGNIIKDTLNWVLITGTFVASGNEKYLVLGNFQTDAGTNYSVINPFNSSPIVTEVLYDDVSCIDYDLPAFAGQDTTFFIGDSLYLGRESDVGIDEACIWYKLPGTTPIDTIAGFWIKPTQTSTYVVRQEICGNVKWDTVTVYMDAVGVQKLRIKNVELRIIPQPASDHLEISVTNSALLNESYELQLLDMLGQVVLEKEISFENNSVKVDVSDLPNGMYLLQLTDQDKLSISRRVVVAH